MNDHEIKNILENKDDYFELTDKLSEEGCSKYNYYRPILESNDDLSDEQVPPRQYQQDVHLINK